MSYQTSDRRLPAVREALRLLDGAKRVILTTHANADGDGVGCQVALLSFLEGRGAKAWIVNPTPFPGLYRFLVEDPERILEAGSSEAEERCLGADLCVVVDTAEDHRIGRVKPMVEHLPRLVVDHHPGGDDAGPRTSLIDPEASAAGELVYDLILEAGGPWSQAVVDGLYVAILTDTGSFRFSNATPAAHRVAADLIQKGASPDRLYNQVYGSLPLRAFRLRARALDTLEVSPGGKVAWMTVPGKLFRELGCTSDDLEGLVDYPRTVQGVEVALVFREVEGGKTKISFRSNGPANVNELARLFEGGGHERAAGALVAGSLDEVRERAITEAVLLVEAEARGTEGPEEA